MSRRNIATVLIGVAAVAYKRHYHIIAGKFGRELNLAVWQSILQSPN